MKSSLTFLTIWMSQGYQAIKLWNVEALSLKQNAQKFFLVLSQIKLLKVIASRWNFTIFFGPEIKDLVLESINYSVVKNRMSNDQRKGVITLVPKRIKTEQI